MEFIIRNYFQVQKEHSHFKKITQTTFTLKKKQMDLITWINK